MSKEYTIETRKKMIKEIVDSLAHVKEDNIYLFDLFVDIENLIVVPIVCQSNTDGLPARDVYSLIHKEIDELLYIEEIYFTKFNIVFESNPNTISITKNDFGDDFRVQFEDNLITSFCDSLFTNNETEVKHV